MLKSNTVTQNKTSAEFFKSAGPVTAIVSAAIPFTEYGLSIVDSSHPRRSWHIVSTFSNGTDTVLSYL